MDPVMFGIIVFGLMVCMTEYFNNGGGWPRPPRFGG